MLRFPKYICLVLLLLLPVGSAAAAELKDFEFAKTLLAEGEWAAAMNFFGLAISDGGLTRKQLAVAHHLRGVSRAKFNKHRLALRDYKKATALDRGYVAAWWSICNHHIAVTAQLDEALAACNRALSLDSNHAPSYALRSEVMHGKGRTNSAEADFAEAIRLDPKNWSVYFKFGLFYHDTEQPAEAKKNFATAYKLAPAHARRQMAAVPVFQGYGVSQ